MKPKLMLLTLLSISTLFIVPPAQSQTKPSQVAPSVSFGNSTVFGIDSRFPITSNISLRPTLRFPSGGIVIGSSATYDFDLSSTDSRIEPYLGAGLNAYTGDNNNNGANVSGYAIGGVDYSLDSQFVLKGSVAVPFNSQYSTDFTVGVGYKF
jgi:outer membrane protein W